MSQSNAATLYKLAVEQRTGETAGAVTVEWIVADDIQQAIEVTQREVGAVLSAKCVRSVRIAW